VTVRGDHRRSRRQCQREDSEKLTCHSPVGTFGGGGSQQKGLDSEEDNGRATDYDEGVSMITGQEGDGACGEADRPDGEPAEIVDVGASTNG